MPYAKSRVILDNSSSTLTSVPYFVGDAKTLTFSIVSQVDDGGGYLVQGSNDHGFNAAITNWSTISTINLQGMFGINPGVRWVRAVRPSASSITVTVAYSI